MINRFYIKEYNQREAMIMALTSNGYKCWIEEEKDNLHNVKHFVVVEY